MPNATANAKAQADYSRALQINPNYDVAYIGRGNLYRKMGRDLDAFRDFESAIQLDTTDPRAYHNRGLIYQSRGQHAYAIEDFSTAISLSGDAAEPYNGRGISYMALGDDEWETIVEAPPGHVTIGTMLHHALWDCWTHERDIVLPLGIEPVEDPVEVTCVLAHAIGLTAAFAMQFVDSRSARIGVLAVDPLVELTVNVARTTVVSFDSPPAGVPVLTGSAVDLAEGITCRQPLDLSSLGEQAWVVEGLAEVFAPAGPSEVE